MRLYLDWCAAKPAEPFTRAALNLWFAELLDAGAAAATARARQLAVRRLSSWLTDEGVVIDDDTQLPTARLSESGGSAEAGCRPGRDHSWVWVQPGL